MHRILVPADSTSVRKHDWHKGIKRLFDLRAGIFSIIYSSCFEFFDHQNPKLFCSFKAYTSTLCMLTNKRLPHTVSHILIGHILIPNSIGDQEKMCPCAPLVRWLNCFLSSMVLIRDPPNGPRKYLVNVLHRLKSRRSHD